MVDSSKLGHILYLGISDEKGLAHRKSVTGSSVPGLGILDMAGVKPTITSIYTGLFLPYEEHLSPGLIETDFDGEGLLAAYHGKLTKKIRQSRGRVLVGHNKSGLFGKKVPLYQEKYTEVNTPLKTSEVLLHGGNEDAYAFSLLTIRQTLPIDNDKRSHKLMVYSCIMGKRDYKGLLSEFKDKEARRVLVHWPHDIFGEWWERYLGNLQLGGDVELFDNPVKFRKFWHMHH